MIIEVNSAEEMIQLGERIGRVLSGGAIVELIGDIGAGKTTLTKGIGIGLGVTETIQSPTFTLNCTYTTPSGVRLAHYDFYRLHDPGVMAAELEETIHDVNTVTVIEWGDIVTDVLPGDHSTVAITSPTENSRRLTITGALADRLGEQRT